MLVLGSTIDYNKSVIPALVFTVTNNLTNCTSSNNATTATENTSYLAIITADSGYSLDGATVGITMGGVDITSTAYSNGEVSIANVTGNIVITVSAAALQPVNPGETGAIFEKRGGSGIPMLDYGNNDGMYGLEVEFAVGDSFHIWDWSSTQMYGWDNLAQDTENSFTNSNISDGMGAYYIECLVAGTYTIAFNDGTMSGTKDIFIWSPGSAPQQP